MSERPDVRAEAARAVARVLAGRNLDAVLAEARIGPQDSALLKAMAFGVVREYALLSALAGRMLQKPLEREPEVHALVLTGLFQLRSMRVPEHAAVSATVSAVDVLNKSWAKGLVN